MIEIKEVNKFYGQNQVLTDINLKINDGEGQVLLSYKRLAQDRGNKKLEDAFNNHEVLTGKVVNLRY